MIDCESDRQNDNRKHGSDLNFFIEGGVDEVGDTSARVSCGQAID